MRLCIFARTPRLGQVKRRLALEIGAPAALETYVALAEDTFARLAAVEGMSAELWLAGPVNDVVRRWLQTWSLPLHIQQGDDLGARMAQALACSHAEGARAVVVGTDCPPVDGAYVRRAVLALDEVDVVLGPATDGGYALVGTRAPAVEIFRDIPWGTSAVLDATLTRVRELGLAVRLLEPVWDVDTAEDLARLRR